MQGTIEEGVVPGLLREIYVGRKSGTLQFLRGTERYSVRFARGTIVNVQTNVTEGRLGELLQKKGLVSAHDLARAANYVVREKMRLGQALIKIGALEESKLEDAIALHVHDSLTKVFTWNEGTYEFVEEDVAEGDSELTLKLSTGELILDAVRAVTDPDVVRYALGDIDRVLQHSPDPLLRFQKITLSPADGFVLSRVDGVTSAREVVQLMPLPAEETQKSLFGLLCTGIVEYGEKRARAAPARPAAAAAPPPPLPSPPIAPSPAPPAPPPPPATAAPPAASAPPAAPRAPLPAPPAPLPAPAAGTAAPAADSGASRRKEILEAFETMKEKNHFELMGIERTATEVQVKEAYFRLAKRFHPDVHHGESLTDLRDQLEALFIKLGQAYETLKNPKTREAYEARLPRDKATGRALPGPPEPEPPPAPPDPEAIARQAEEDIRKAEKHIEKEKYWDAIQLLDTAIPLAKNPKLIARGHIAMAKAKLKNPKWVKEAENTLKELLRLDPKHVEAHFMLGSIYKAGGLKARSESMFRKVLELQPDHEGATSEMSSIPAESPSPDGGASEGGLFKKFFKKGN
jgi:tetratricopeptide (TPR) repeat protein